MLCRALLLRACVSTDSGVVPIACEFRKVRQFLAVNRVPVELAIRTTRFVDNMLSKRSTCPAGCCCSDVADQKRSETIAQSKPQEAELLGI